MIREQLFFFAGSGIRSIGLSNVISEGVNIGASYAEYVLKIRSRKFKVCLAESALNVIKGTCADIAAEKNIKNSRVWDSYYKN